MLRFTIRDVLWLMVVVGLVLGWLLDRSGLATKISTLELKQGLVEIANQVTYDEYKKIMRLIKESGQALVWHPDGTTTLEKSDQDASRDDR
jgi:hypothetical protein